MAQSPFLVVVEDEPAQRQLLVTYLGKQGFRMAGVEDGPALRRLMERDTPTLILLDVGLPGQDGVQLARTLRAKDARIGIIMVTAAHETIDRVLGLEAGADDYILKPFDPRELLARVRSVLRRIAAAPALSGGPPLPGACVRMGRCILDLDRRQLLQPDGTPAPLAASEFDLLRLLAENPNRPLAREWLLERTSHRDPGAFDRTIDLRITRLRRKVEAAPAYPDVIRTVRGIGYMFVPGT